MFEHRSWRGGSISISISISISLSIYLFIHPSIYLSIYLSIYIYIYTYINIHIYIYTYIYIYPCLYSLGLSHSQTAKNPGRVRNWWAAPRMDKPPWRRLGDHFRRSMTLLDYTYYNTIHNVFIYIDRYIYIYMILYIVYIYTIVILIY